MIFYKYRPCNIFAYYNLSSDTIYHSAPKDLNDPYDSNIVTKFDHFYFAQIMDYLRSNDDDNFQILEYAYNKKEKTLEEIKELIGYLYIEKYFRDIKICSFSETWNNQVMWTHYSDNQKGICIGYNTVEKDNKYYLKKSNNTFLKIEKVRYKNYYGKITYIPELVKKVNHQYLFLRKSNLWRYEKEYRSIIYDKIGNDVYLDNTVISEIIFGIKCSHFDKQVVKKLINDDKHAIKYYQLKIGESGLIRDEI